MKRTEMDDKKVIDKAFPAGMTRLYQYIEGHIAMNISHLLMNCDKIDSLSYKVALPIFPQIFRDCAHLFHIPAIHWILDIRENFSHKYEKPTVGFALYVARTDRKKYDAMSGESLRESDFICFPCGHYISVLKVTFIHRDIAPGSFCKICGAPILHIWKDSVSNILKSPDFREFCAKLREGIALRNILKDYYFNYDGPASLDHDKKWYAKLFFRYVICEQATKFQEYLASGLIPDQLFVGKLIVISTLFSGAGPQIDPFVFGNLLETEDIGRKIRIGVLEKMKLMVNSDVKLERKRQYIFDLVQIISKRNLEYLCIICLRELKFDKCAVFLPCGHVICAYFYYVDECPEAGCLKKYKSDLCPTCRQKIRDVFHLRKIENYIFDE
jgi:hypothetical protein